MDRDEHQTIPTAEKYGMWHVFKKRKQEPECELDAVPTEITAPDCDNLFRDNRLICPKCLELWDEMRAEKQMREMKAKQAARQQVMQEQVGFGG